MSLDISQLKAVSWEREYLLAIFSHLPEVKAHAFHGWWGRDLVKAAPKIHHNDVLVMVSNEMHQRTPVYPCRFVLRQYDACDHGFPIPLGLKNGFPSMRVKLMSQRKYDVVFAGSGHAGRTKLMDALNADPRIKALKTNLSCKRVSMKEYAEQLYDSRIAISPRGGISPECFRWFEATRCGCVVVHPKFVDNWIYRNAPGVSVVPFDANNATAIVDAVVKLLDNPADLQSRSDAAVKHWNDRLAPAAVAARIRQLLAAHI